MFIYMSANGRVPDAVTAVRSVGCSPAPLRIRDVVASVGGLRLKSGNANLIFPERNTEEPIRRGRPLWRERLAMLTKIARVYPR